MNQPITDAQRRSEAAAEVREQKPQVGLTIGEQLAICVNTMGRSLDYLTEKYGLATAEPINYWPLTAALDCAGRIANQLTEQKTDPLPVMEEAVEWLANYEGTTGEELTCCTNLLNTVHALRRERGMTDAAKEVRDA